MISNIIPHGPPIQDPAPAPSASTDPTATFDQFLPDQPPPDTSASTEDDAPAAPGIITTGPMLPQPGNGVPGAPPGIRPGVPFDHFLPDPPPTNTTGSPDDDTPPNPGMITTGPMLPRPGTGTPDADGPLAGNPGLITTGPMFLSRWKLVTSVSDSPPLPTMITTGPMQPKLGNMTADGDDSTGVMEFTETGPVRPLPQKDLKPAATGPTTPDVGAMAAQLAALIGLRPDVPAVTLTPLLTPPTSTVSNNAGAPGNSGLNPEPSVIASVGGDSMQTASVNALVGTVTRGVGTDVADMPTLPAPGVDTPPPQTANVAPGQINALPDLASVSVTLGAVPDTLLPPAPEIASMSAVTDSRLADVQIKSSGLPKIERAKIAGLVRADFRAGQSANISKTQESQQELLTVKEGAVGTPGAMSVGVVNSIPTTHENPVDADASSERDTRVEIAKPAVGRAWVSQPSASEAIINSAITNAAGVGSSASQAATATTTISPAPTGQAVRIETLLQNALSVGESVRPEGQGQMEMRVSLGSGAEDVTVRMQVTNDRLQVTFQTNSPDLRKALEHGWQQLSATAAQTSTLSLDQPRFEASRVAAPAGGQPDTAAFSSNQQNARQQNPGTTAGEDFAAATPARSTSANTSAATTASVAGQAAGERWNRWA